MKKIQSFFFFFSKIWRVKMTKIAQPPRFIRPPSRNFFYFHAAATAARTISPTETAQATVHHHGKTWLAVQLASLLLLWSRYHLSSFAPYSHTFLPCVRAFPVWLKMGYQPLDLYGWYLNLFFLLLRILLKVKKKIN